MGRTVIELDQLELSSASVPEELFERESIDEDKLSEYSDYWGWTDVREIVGKYFDSTSIERGMRSGSSENHLYYSVRGKIESDGKSVAIQSTECNTEGELAIIAEYDNPVSQGMGVLYRGIIPWDDVDAIAIGRRISSLELSYLAHQTGSCAAALDYWQTGQDGWYRQHEWAKIREVGRQTINDRIRHATNSLQ